MRRAFTLVAVLLLLTTAAPVLACVTDRAMNHTESVCCRAMHGQCGDMAKQGCCRTESYSQAPQFATQSAVLATHWVIFAHLPHPLIVVAAVSGPRAVVPDEYSPPGLLYAATTILRI